MSGVLAAVEAAVRAGAMGERDVLASLGRRVAEVGPMSAADVADALATLRVVGVVRSEVGRGWSPGTFALADLPVPVAELEREWARGRKERRFRDG